MITGKWTEEEKLKLETLCKEGLRLKEIAKRLDRTRSSIARAKLKWNVEQSKYTNTTTNVDFFRTWSNDMAYILGFLTADGCIRKNDSGNYHIVVNIHQRDIEVLEFIKSKIRPTANICKYDDFTAKGLEYPHCILKITSQELCCPLPELGVFERKGGKEFVPNVPDEFFGDYLRGMFDGDGSITYRKKGSIKFNITLQSATFLETLKQKCGNIGCLSRQGTTYGWDVSGVDDLYYLYNLMYSNNCFSMSRKKRRFKIVKKLYSIKQLQKHIKSINLKKYINSVSNLGVKNIISNGETSISDFQNELKNILNMIHQHQEECKDIENFQDILYK